MQISFNDITNKIIQIYLDDIIVYSRICQDHFDHLRQFFLHFRKFVMSLDPTISIFNVIIGKLLGHIIFDSSIGIDL